jgi:hypothetical protein
MEGTETVAGGETLMSYIHGWSFRFRWLMLGREWVITGCPWSGHWGIHFKKRDDHRALTIDFYIWGLWFDTWLWPSS